MFELLNVSFVSGAGRCFVLLAYNVIRFHWWKFSNIWVLTWVLFSSSCQCISYNSQRLTDYECFSFIKWWIDISTVLNEMQLNSFGQSAFFFSFFPFLPSSLPSFLSSFINVATKKYLFDECKKILQESYSFNCNKCACTFQNILR